MRCRYKNIECKYAGDMTIVGCKELGEAEGMKKFHLCYNDKIFRDPARCDKKRMSREDYEAKRAEINKQLAELKEQYIRDNTEIEPGSTVMAAGQKCILKGYTITGGLIYPILVKFSNRSSKVYVSSNAKLEKV